MKTFISPEIQGFRDFDLPVVHLLEDRYHITPKAYDPEEIARRRELTPGTLILENQAKGLDVARLILTNIEEPEGMLYVADILAQAELNTAWCVYARGESDVMRRRLRLPDMSNGRSLDRELLLEDAIELVDKAKSKTTKLMDANEYRLATYSENKRLCGRVVGNASLRLAVYGAVATGVMAAHTDNVVDLQARARLECTRALNAARDAHRVMGAHPTMKGLSDGDSHLAVYMRRHAPGKHTKQVISEAIAA